MANITDNKGEVLSALNSAKARALEIIGGKVESYAKGLAPVDTGALRNSITHRMDGETVIVGSAIHYAPYVELGTGRNFEAPPQWMQNNAPRGAGAVNGVKSRPFLRPAVENHIDEYKDIITKELKNA